MLILTRKIGEVIRIGDTITVRVLALRGGQVSLGFTAPNDVRIFREEVLLASGELELGAPAPLAKASPAAAAPAGKPRSSAVARGGGRPG